jgi:hypothetical protein
LGGEVRFGTLPGMRYAAISWAAWLAAAVPLGAALLDEEPLPELRLASGTVLKMATVRGYSEKAALVKHAGGAATVAYPDFPAEYQDLLASRRRAFSASAAATGEDAGGNPLAEVSYDFSPAPALPPASEASAEVTLAGEVFVETHDAGSVKLAGVRVSVYGRAEYRKQAEWYFAQPWEASRAHTRNAELLTKAGDPAAAMRHFLAATEIAALGWQLIAPAQYSTLTDAEGRFTLKHRLTEPYFVVAQASRVVEGETEHYRWVMLSEHISDPRRVLLFNDTME